MITTVCFGKPITTSNENPSSEHLQYYKEWQGKHILEINFAGIGENDQLFFPNEIINYILPTGEKLVDVIENIAFTGLDDSQPTPMVFQCLEFFKPRHLLYLCGWDEHCDLSTLDTLGTTWPLESIVIMGSCGDKLKTKYLQQITSLTLDHCCGTTVKFNGTCCLKNLILIENDVISQFLGLVPNIKNTIESVQIVGYNGCDIDFKGKSFPERLSECKNLSQLYFGHLKFIKNFPIHLPPNLTSLYYNGPPKSKENLDLWMNCVCDIHWLPKLTTFEYSLNAINGIKRNRAEWNPSKDDFLKDQNEIVQMLFVIQVLPKEIRRLIVQKIIVIQRKQRLMSKFI